MTVCPQATFDFPAANRRAVHASFTGGDVSSDGGVLLVRQVDRRSQSPARHGGFGAGASAAAAKLDRY